MKKIKQKDVIITTKLNMEEIDTILEALDYMIRNCDDAEWKLSNEFSNKLSDVRKDVQKIYGKAFDYKKEQESQQQPPMRNPMYDIMEEDDHNKEETDEV
tara:strand:- start:582 stop:881 length:300 start_codon:yes stop_codon:yes gene_type:complete